MAWTTINSQDAPEPVRAESPADMKDDNPFGWKYLEPRYVGAYSRRPKLRTAILESTHRIAERWPKVARRRAPPAAPVLKKRTVFDAFDLAEDEELDDEAGRKPAKRARRPARASRLDSDKENLPAPESPKPKPVRTTDSTSERLVKPFQSVDEPSSPQATSTHLLDTPIANDLASEAESTPPSKRNNSATACLTSSPTAADTGTSDLASASLLELAHAIQHETSSDYSASDSLFETMLHTGSPISSWSLEMSSTMPMPSPDSISQQPPTITGTISRAAATAEFPSSADMLSPEKLDKGPTSKSIAPFLRTHPKPSLAFNSDTPFVKVDNRVLTFFRIAEVLRLSNGHGHPASISENVTITLELYARVKFSYRTSENQHIRFADLFFPHSPPYIDGVYTAWKNSSLADADSASLITGQTGRTMDRSQTTDHKLCRAIVTVPQKKPTEQGSQAKGTIEVEVLSIWETDWEDVMYVKGIVEPVSEES